MPKLILTVLLLYTCFRGSFLTECDTNQYIKDSMCIQCSGTCAKCLSEHLCMECVSGYWGDECSKQCSKGCLDDTCSQNTGLCVSCADGHYFKQSTNVCLKCPERCTTCLSVDQCSRCEIGFRGRTCEDACTNCKRGTGCVKDIDVCVDACADGFSGNNCTIRCNERCKACNRFDLNKCTSCLDGLYGDDCKEMCSRNCIDSLCNTNDNSCIHGCEKGFWGDKCENICPENCLNGICLRGSGHCSDGCLGNFTGLKCQCIGVKCRSDKGKSESPVVAVVVGILVFIALGAAVSFVTVRRKRSKMQLKALDEPSSYSDEDHCADVTGENIYEKLQFY